MMRKNFKLLKEEMDEIIKINKTGGDPLIYLSGGIPIGRSLEDKINDFWESLGGKYGFDWESVKGISNSEYSAEIDNGRKK